MRFATFLIPVVCALFAGPALAQTPARFPSVPAAELEHIVRHARCADTLTTIARTAAEIEGWRGFAMLLCDPDGERQGAFVAWRSNRDGSVFVPARADGVPFPTAEGGFSNVGDQQAQLTVFGVRFQDGPAVCALARLNHIREPFAASFCHRR